MLFRSRPMEMFLTGLGGCTASHLIHILKKGRQKVRDCVIELESTRREKEPRIFSHIHIHYIVSGESMNHSKVTRAVQLSAEKYCSASEILRETATITYDLEIIEV